MDFRAFEKSPGIAPLLVRLHDGQSLYKLAKDKRPEAQAELTGAVAELLDVELSAREQELLTDVLIALIRQAETDLRQAVSERLSSMDNVPLRLALHIANDEISVASPFLRCSPIFSDLDLIYIIKSKGCAYWKAIAARETLSDELIDVLAETKDTGTVVALSRNQRITLTRHAISILSEMAKTDESLALPLLGRPEIPPAMAQALYEHVGQELKTRIRSFYRGPEATLAEKAIDDVLQEITVGVSSSEYMPPEQTLALAEKFSGMGLLNLNVMLETLQRGQISSFIAMFGKYTGLSARRIHDFLQQPCPKGLAIACRAFGIQKADFSRIYLMTHRMRSKDRIINQEDMMEILSYFDRVRPEAAQRIVQRVAG